jgi:hypothetical protein
MNTGVIAPTNLEVNVFHLAKCGDFAIYDLAFVGIAG